MGHGAGEFRLALECPRSDPVLKRDGAGRHERDAGFDGGIEAVAAGSVEASVETCVGSLNLGGARGAEEAGGLHDKIVLQEDCTHNLAAEF